MRPDSPATPGPRRPVLGTVKVLGTWGPRLPLLLQQINSNTAVQSDTDCAPYSGGVQSLAQVPGG